MNTWKVSILIMFLTLSPVGSATTGGQELAWQGDLSRFVVRLTFSGMGYKTFCTGTLISNREVLTAGHCLLGPLKRPLADGQIYAEIYDASSPQGFKRIQLTGANSRFEGPLDIAIAFLAEDAGLGEANFPTLATAPCSKTSELHSIGFGLDENSLLPAGPKMSTYREVEGSEDFIAGVSAHRGSGRNCFGDSGGPVFCKLYQRQVIASVNSRISGSIFDMVHYLLGQIPPGEYCAKADVIWGVRMSTHKKLILQLRKTD